MAWAPRSNRIVPGNWRTIKARILERDGHRCYVCGATATEVDHLVNVAAGGTHEDDNLAAICEPCHKRKTQREAQAGRVSQRRPSERHPGLLRTPGGNPLRGWDGIRTVRRLRLCVHSLQFFPSLRTPGGGYLNPGREPIRNVLRSAVRVSLGLPAQAHFTLRRGA